MGFLEVGKPMTWEDSPNYYKVLEYVLKHGVIQFLEMFHTVKDRKNDILKWGDEVEYHLFKFNHNEQIVQINCIAAELMKKLEAEDKELRLKGETNLPTWHPEFGAWMIEATPGAPYGNKAEDLRDLEKSLAYRRARIKKALGENEDILLLPVWMRLGCEQFVTGYQEVYGEYANSRFVPDSVINPHPRFGTLVRNIRKRRGRNVNINVPIFKDEKTNLSALNEGVAKLKMSDDIDNKSEIFMDAMAFGMGSCCLQVTFQARDLKESRYLYDQLSVLCPIFLSLSAGSPVFKGLLAETDVRWNVISQSVDCRTRKEYGFEEEKDSGMKRGKFPIRKSRYASVDLFISDSPLLTNHYDYYNDVNAEFDEDTYKKLTEGGVDKYLSKHVAHLFIRDPLVIFVDRIEVDDTQTTQHFENIQSTNWQTMRWKPPPVASNDKEAIGWRVEFRPMEVQMTDFENAAYTVVIVLLSRVILFFNLNLYMPISKIDQNMETAHKMDSVLKEKFHFRKNLIPLESECDGLTTTKLETTTDFDVLSVAEILNGKGENFPGLFPLIYAYLEIIGCNEETYELLNTYLNFLKLRSEGKIKTLSRWMRDFILSHPDYKKDSKVSKKIEYDLVCATQDITSGRTHDESLLGQNKVTPFDLGVISGDAVPTDGRRHLKSLRGSSFSEKFTDLHRMDKHNECQIVLDLIAKYRNIKSEFLVTEKTGFAETPAFLPNLSS